MKTEVKKEPSNDKVIIKLCHVCGKLTESYAEPMRCSKCNKAFLPANYFSKIHAKNSTEFEHLFANSDELADEDMVKGISVIW